MEKSDPENALPLIYGPHTIFRPAVSASRDRSGQRSVFRHGRDGAVGRFGATIVGIFAFVDSSWRNHFRTKEYKNQDFRQRRKMLLVGGQDLTDLETQGRPQRLRPRGSRGRSTPPKVGSITSYQNGLLHSSGFPLSNSSKNLANNKVKQGIMVLDLDVHLIQS